MLTPTVREIQNEELRAQTAAGSAYDHVHQRALVPASVLGDGPRDVYPIREESRR